MARDMIYLEGLWETDLLFSSYENYGNSILGHGNQETNVGDQISSPGPNIMSNENQMAQQLESGLIGDVVVGHGSQEKNVGLEIMSSLGLNNTMSNENQRAQQLEAGLIWDGMVGHVHQEKNAGYEMSSLGPNTTCIENQMQQQVNVLGSIRGVDVGNIMLPHGGRNENEGHVVAQKRKGKEITDLEHVGKEKEKKKRKNTNRQPLDMETRVKIEQERRRKEAQLYADLRAMHPNLHPKAAKFRVIEETMSSIESFNQTLRSLEKQKLEMLLGLFTNTSTMEPLEPSQSPATNKESPLLSSINSNTISGTSLNTFKTWTSSNVTLSVCGTCAVISICSLKRHGLFTTICLILKNHNLDVVSAEIFTNHAKTMYMIHVRGYVPPEFTEGFPHEKLYQKAVAQIIFCLDL